MGQHRRVLVIEDDPVDQRFISRALLKADEEVTVEVAGDGMAGLEALTSHPLPDIILFDLSMPRLDGFGFVEALRRRGSGKALPALVLTTSMDKHDIELSYEKGANAYLTKPTSLAEYDKLAKSVLDFWFGTAVTSQGTA